MRPLLLSTAALCLLCGTAEAGVRMHAPHGRHHHHRDRDTDASAAAPAPVSDVPEPVFTSGKPRR